LIESIEEGNCDKVVEVVKKAGLILGPAMLWASWKETNNSFNVINTLISLGGKPNQVF